MPSFLGSRILTGWPSPSFGMGGAVSTKAALAKAKAARSKMEDAATSGKVYVHSADLLAAPCLQVCLHLRGAARA